MSITTMTKARDADGAITKFRIVKKGTAEYDMAQATAASESLIGINTGDTLADNEDGEMVIFGFAEAELGSTVTAGDFLTADADGKAVPTTTPTEYYIARAINNGVAGDISEVFVLPGII